MLSPSAYSKANVHEKVTCPAPAALQEIRTVLIALGRLPNESNPESSTACIRGEPSSQAKGSRCLRTSPGGAGEGRQIKAPCTPGVAGGSTHVLAFLPAHLGAFREHSPCLTMG